LLTSVLPAEGLAAGRAIMAYFATFADEKGRVPGPVALSTTMLLELCGEARISVDGFGRSRVYVVVMRRLLELGLVTIHVDYSNGRHGRSYCVWYAFGSGQAPAPGENGRILLGQRPVREGDLEALLEGKRARVVLRPRHVGCPTGAWWVRMFTRRAFTPGEFFGAEERHVLPGPFRDRRQPEDLPRVGSGDTPSSPPPRPPSGDPAHGRGDTAAPQHRSTVPAPASAPANDNASVSPVVSPAAIAHAPVPRPQGTSPPSARRGAELAEAVALAWTAFEHFEERGRPAMRVVSRRKAVGSPTSSSEDAPSPPPSALHAVLSHAEAAWRRARAPSDTTAPSAAVAPGGARGDPYAADPPRRSEVAALAWAAFDRLDPSDPRRR
jgi:hypothetical protein